jgi:3-hydroxyacyl-CoA dehydrogenase/enoyl-CoA hydratase/3-hydroxybutyryl-CoA epimerase/enoyl-CoA isomerase
MPLVEVIRGTQTSAETIAKVVSLAQKLGKTPIVVNDCPGFFVNRVLFPYFQAFTQLVSDGADFRHIDKVMKGYGWPMGPAELLDTVGIDTAYHAAQTMAASFPDRMSHDKTNVLDQLFMAGLLGKKTGHGFYQYQADAKGKIQAAPDEGLALSWMQENLALTDEQIIERMMIPLCLEAWRCLDEKVIDSPSEGDMALVYGLGFPPFQGGVFHYLDSIGAENFAELVTQYQDLGALYQLTDGMRSRIEQGMAFYSPASLVAGGAA